MTTKRQNQGTLIKLRQGLMLGVGMGLWGGLVSTMPLSCPSIVLDGFFPSVVAAELPGGISFFTAPPQLVDSTTTFDGVSVPSPRYYFTIALPNNAGSPLAKVVFQRQDSPDPIDFEAEQTQAFTGDRQNRGASIALNPTDFNRETGQITVSFATPIAPGETVTILLRPVQNPDVPGVYQFRLFAFPAGANAQSMDLGVARFQFYRGIF